MVTPFHVYFPALSIRGSDGDTISRLFSRIHVRCLSTCTVSSMVEEATILLDLAAKRYFVNGKRNDEVYTTVSARGIIELENTQEAASQCILSLSFDVKNTTNAQA